eukprot:3294869-Pyramimonas_sp.AAC.1
MGFGSRPRLSTMPRRQRHTAQYVSDPETDVLYELRLYHWTAAALWVADAYADLLRVARHHERNLEVGFEFERRRDQERTDATNVVRDAQTAW